MQNFEIAGVIILMLIFFIVIQPFLYKMRQRQQMMRFMDVIINQVQNYGNKDERHHRNTRSGSSGFGTLLTLGIGVALSVFAYQNSQTSEASTTRGPTGIELDSADIMKGDLTQPTKEQKDTMEFSPFDAPRKRGHYIQAPPARPIDPSNEAAQSVRLSGYGQQLISLHSRESVLYNLERALTFYSEAKVIIIEEAQANGDILYKGVIGQFDNIDAARAAFPDLEDQFEGQFPVSLEGLVIQPD